MTPDEYKLVQSIYLELLEHPPKKRLKLLQEKDVPTRIYNEVKDLLQNTSEDTILEDRKIKVEPSTTQKLLKKSFVATLFSASLVIRTYILLGLAVIIALGFWTHNRVKWELKDIRESELKTTTLSLKQSLEFWINDYKHDVKRLSHDREFRELAIELVNKSETLDSLRFLNDSIHFKIHSLMSEMIDSSRYSLYSLASKKGFSITSNKKLGIGLEVSGKGKEHYLKVFGGEISFLPPFSPSNWTELDSTIQPIVLISVPVYDFNDNVIAAFSVSRNAHDEFAKLLCISRLGETGETYVINENGLLLTESRFSDQLKSYGLIDKNSDRGMLDLYIKDPGVDLEKGLTPSEQPESWRLTKAAQTVSTLALEDSNAYGISLDAYRSYKGNKVIGAWIWMKDYGFGMISEISVDEAYSALPYLTISFIVIVILLSLLFVYSSVKSLRVEALKKEIKEGRVGNYTLNKKIGEGGMSRVYLASHDMLKRPTAIKILKKDQLNSTTLNRFKTEVKQASRLSHPNTISIFDYGETKDGVFYYAMEFIDGLNIKQVVKMNGALPIGRVVYIMLQACNSLKEAHGLNLIHRDIKPQNIMVCVKGGIFDMVKVLDFGLVKDLDNNQEHTRQSQIEGTPLYMSPERITNPHLADQRSDIYALAAVAYYMAAGVPVFEYKNDLDIMANIINVVPKSLVEVDPRIPLPFSELIDRCLSKNLDDRPDNIGEVVKILNDLRKNYPWSQDDSKQWWSRFDG